MSSEHATVIPTMLEFGRDFKIGTVLSRARDFIEIPSNSVGSNLWKSLFLVTKIPINDLFLIAIFTLYKTCSSEKPS